MDNCGTSKYTTLRHVDMNEASEDLSNLLWKWVQHLDGEGDRPKDIFVKNFTGRNGDAIIQIINSRDKKQK